MARSYFARSLGNNTGGSTPIPPAPDTPNLLVTDNANGTGGIATITNGDAAATNYLYGMLYTGAAIEYAAVLVGSRTGNGTITIASPTPFPLGSYNWLVLSGTGGPYSFVEYYRELTSGGSTPTPGPSGDLSSGYALLANILTNAKRTIVAGISEWADAIDVSTFTLSSDYVYINFTPERVRDVGENHITVRVEAPLPDSLGGAGRLATRVKRNLVVNIFTRLDLDAEARDDIWYTSAAIGHSMFEDAVINCFHDRFLYDSDLTTKLTQLPVHWMPGASPAQRPTPDNSWGWSSLVFELDYVQGMVVDYLDQP